MLVVDIHYIDTASLNAMGIVTKRMLSSRGVRKMATRRTRSRATMREAFRRVAALINRSPCTIKLNAVTIDKVHDHRSPSP